MTTEARFPRFIAAVSTLGADRLRELAAGARLDFEGTDAHGLAARLLAAIDRPEDLRRFGARDHDVEALGQALGLGPAATWTPRCSPEEFARLPFYAKPTYELDVWAALASAPHAPAVP